VKLILLPGLDGLGLLLDHFTAALPATAHHEIIRYPPDVYLSYEELAGRIRDLLPRDGPYIILAESYSGPLALQFAARPVGDLRAVVLVASFASYPWGRFGPWIARLRLAPVFRRRPPLWLLQWFLMDGLASRDDLAKVRETIASVHPEVLASRLKEVLCIDRTALLRDARVRLVVLMAAADRLIGQRASRTFLQASPSPEVLTIQAPHLLLQCAPNEARDALIRLGLLDAPIPRTRT